MTIQTVGSIGFGAHTTWVSYLTRTPEGKWVHTTLWDLPAHTRVNVTDLQYDTGSPLRNQYFGLVRGTVGGTMTLNGHVVSLINSNAGFGLGSHLHRFQPRDQRAPLRGQPELQQNLRGSAVHAQLHP